MRNTAMFILIIFLFISDLVINEQTFARQGKQFWDAKKTLSPLLLDEDVIQQSPKSVLKPVRQLPIPNKVQGGENPSFSHGLSGYESGTRLMGFKYMWDKGIFGHKQVVAVTDTGLDSGEKSTLHRDLRKIESVRIFSKNPSWGDSFGHGTLVSGLINGGGVLSRGRIKGGAYGASLISQSIWEPLATTKNTDLEFQEKSSKRIRFSAKGGMVYPKDLKKLFIHSYKNGARVHNLSFGSGEYGTYTKNAQIIDEFIWRKQDMLIVIAAGNTGVDKDRDGRVDKGSITPPATSKNALVVGASENLVDIGGMQVTNRELNNGLKKWPAAPLRDDFVSNNPGGLAAFSARGPTKDGRIKPDVLAPGTNILSTRSQHSEAGSFWGEYNQYYAYGGGTSMSAALVSAAAVLTREFFIKTYGLKKPSAALVKAALLHTARDIFPGQYGENGVNKGQEILHKRPGVNQGFGVVDLKAVSKLFGDTVKVRDHREGVSQGERQEFDFEIKQKKLLTTTLVYSDVPGSRRKKKALVNDLDIVLYDLGRKKTVFYKKDRVNNVEFAENIPLEKGRYRLVVLGEKVITFKDKKRQPYALVMSLSDK